MIKNKKGSIADFLVMISLVSIVAISFFMGYTVWDKFDEQLNASGLTTQYPQLNQTTQNMDRSFNILDLAWAILFFGFFVALLSSVAFLDTSPWFAIVFVVLFLIIIGVGMILSDAVMEVFNNPEISATGVHFPIMMHVMGNLPYYLFGMMLLFGIILYGVRRNE